MEKIKLDILIPTVPERREKLKSLEENLYRQIADRKDIKVTILSDNKKITIGEKRQDMLQVSKGEYICYADDDDRISDDYIERILKAIETGVDVITFEAEVSINGGNPKTCIYTDSIKSDFNTDEYYFRLPNHLCVVKRELALKAGFPKLQKFEDAEYAKRLKTLIKTSYHIDRVLYYYDYNDSTTLTQINTKSKNSAILDLVILSNAKDVSLQNLTQHTINTAINNTGLRVNVIVVEQNPNVNYLSANTVHIGGDFHYNRFGNMGARLGNAEWVMLANNDLEFQKGWLEELVKVGHPVMSPKEPTDIRQQGIYQNSLGWKCGRFFSGWCFMISRGLYNKIGGFDECVDFWFSDNVVIEQVRKEGVCPMLVSGSIVKHLGSKTFEGVDSNKRSDLAWKNCQIYNKKYGREEFIDNADYKEWQRRNTVICITTRNRNGYVKIVKESWKKVTGCDVIIVDDASDTPVKEATFRFNSNVGIARAKNKCLELAMGRGYYNIVLVDDDVRPLDTFDIYRYLNSPHRHMVSSFEYRIDGVRFSDEVRKDGGDIKYDYYSNGNGYFLYLTRDVVEKVGGMRLDFKEWGLEHREYSNRIYNSGLVEHPFIDVYEGHKDLYICDRDIINHKGVVSEGRRQYLSSRNKEIYEKFVGSTDFVEYRS